MNEERVQWLLMSYGLEHLLEDNDITEEIVLEWLIENGMIDMEKYFDDSDD